MGSKQDIREVNEVSPEDLLAVFSRGRIVLWMLVAVLIHVIVIGATSVGYIRDEWIDREGAKVRREAAAAALAAQKAAEKAAVAQKSAVANAPAEAGGTNVLSGAGVTNAPATAAGGTNAAVAGATEVGAAGTNATPADASDDAMLKARRDTAVVKRITQVAASNELPATPDLGISLEDTATH